MISRARYSVIAMAASAALCGSAQAGPAFRTDDPEPVDVQHWEFIALSSGQRVVGDLSGTTPASEFNYGALTNLQLHVGLPAAFDVPGGQKPRLGYGDTEFGAKYRFIEEDKDGWRPQAAIYPLLEAPTGDRSRGLGAGYARAFFPLWVQKSFGEWTTYGGGGYWLAENAVLGARNSWFFGWLLQRKITEKLTLGGEIFYQSASAVATAQNISNVFGGPENVGVNLGGCYDFDDHNHLLFSAGGGIKNAASTNLFSWYLGWQVTY